MGWIRYNQIAGQTPRRNVAEEQADHQHTGEGWGGVGRGRVGCGGLRVERGGVDREERTETNGWIILVAADIIRLVAAERL